VDCEKGVGKDKEVGRGLVSVGREPTCECRVSLQESPQPEVHLDKQDVKRWKHIMNIQGMIKSQRNILKWIQSRKRWSAHLEQNECTEKYGHGGGLEKRLVSCMFSDFFRGWNLFIFFLFLFIFSPPSPQPPLKLKFGG
jgi:hypothetical protein